MAATTPLGGITDAFNATPLNTSRWTTSIVGNGTANIGNGKLSAGCGNTSSSQGGVRSTDTAITLATDTFLSVSIVHDVAGASRTTMAVRGPGSAQSYFMIQNNVLYCRAYNSAGVAALDQNLTYSATAHRWLRMQFAVSGLNVVTTFEKSTDGTAWTTLYTSTAAAWTALNATSIELTNASAGGTTYRYTSFDQVNLGPALMRVDLTDEFNAAVIDAAKWVVDTAALATATTSGGRLVITTSASSASSYATLTASKDVYRLIGSPVTCKFTASPSANVRTTVQISNPTTGAAAQLRFQGSTCIMYVYSANSTALINGTSYPYDSVGWAWLRLRVDPGVPTLYIEKSPDGITWTAAATAPGFDWGDECQLMLQAANLAAVSGTVTFDKVNLPPTPISALADSFDAASVDASVWTAATNAGTVTVANSLLSLSTTSASTTGSATVTADRDTYRLVGDAIYAQINPSSTTGVATEFLLTQGSYSALMSCLNGVINIKATDSAGTTILNANSAYDPTGWKYWRWRMAANGTDLYADCSPDGNAWINVATVANTGFGSAVTVALRARNNGVAVAGTATVDSVNSPPPPPAGTRPLVGLLHPPGRRGNRAQS